MRVTYDPDLDVLRLIFRDCPVAESDEDKPGVILDYDKDGNIVGLEILDASKRVEDPRTIEFAEKDTDTEGAVEDRNQATPASFVAVMFRTVQRLPRSLRIPIIIVVLVIMAGYAGFVAVPDETKQRILDTVVSTLTSSGPSGTHIVVTEAKYGAGRIFCDATEAFANICYGRSECKVLVNNSLCGDPYPLVVKSAVINWECKDEKTHKTMPAIIVEEHLHAELSCN